MAVSFLWIENWLWKGEHVPKLRSILRPAGMIDCPLRSRYVWKHAAPSSQSHKNVRNLGDAFYELFEAGPLFHFPRNRCGADSPTSLQDEELSLAWKIRFSPLQQL